MNYLSTFFRKYIQDISVHVIFGNLFTIGSVFNYKESLPKEILNSLVYKFSCAQCASEYI